MTGEIRGRVKKNMKVSTKEKSKQGHNSQFLKEDYSGKRLLIKREANSIFLHGPLGGLGAFGPAAQEYAHWGNKHQKDGHRHRGHQHELAITGSIPGRIHCGTKWRDISWDLHHVASRQLFDCGKKEALIQSLAAYAVIYVYICVYCFAQEQQTKQNLEMTFLILW